MGELCGCVLRSDIEHLHRNNGRLTMRACATLLVCLGYFLFVNAVAAQPVDWLLVAKSDLVVVGTLRNLPRDKDDPIRTATNGAHHSVDVLNVKALVGEVPAGTLRVILDGSQQGLPQKKFILFLARAETVPISGFYLADTARVALRPFSSELPQTIARLHAANLTASKKGSAFRPPDGDPVAVEVKRDLDALIEPAERQDAVQRLLDQGDRAVPYLISYLPDFRPLPPGGLSMPAGEGHGFESRQHYQPELMVDAIDLILSRITMMSFRFLGNGATKFERKAVIRAWQTYFGRKLEGE